MGEKIVGRKGSGPNYPPSIEIAQSVIDSHTQAAGDNMHHAAYWHSQAQKKEDHAAWNALKGFSLISAGFIGLSAAGANLAFRGVSVETVVESGALFLASTWFAWKAIRPGKEMYHSGRAGSQYRNYSDDGISMADAHVTRIEEEKKTPGY